MPLFKKISLPVGFALSIVYVLFAPGFWGADALNGYIQAVVGQYSSTQPVFLAFICSVTSHFYQGSLPIFLGCIIFYFLGFALMVYSNIPNKTIAFLLFLVCGFCPLLLASVTVIQTESIQLSVLAIFSPATMLLYNYKGKYRRLLFFLLSLLLCAFWLVRHDTLLVSVLLTYWLCFTILGSNNFKTVIFTCVLLCLFCITSYVLDISLGFNRTCKTEMRNALLITDVAVISAKTNTNYIPEYCWQSYLPSKEHDLEKINYGLREWKYSFFSYLYLVYSVKLELISSNNRLSRVKRLLL